MTEVHWFAAAPSVGELPPRLPSPFAPTPHPLARRAGDELLALLAAGAIAEARGLDAPGAGKMFGVLVVAAADGRVGALRGFSGMLAGRWQVDGFVPPLFDEAARAAFWPAGEAELGELAGALAAVEARLAPLAAAQAELVARHAAELAELRARHLAGRAARRAARTQLAATDGAARHALDQASRADTAERRRLDAAHVDARARLGAPLAALAAERAALEAARAARSRHYLTRIYDTYALRSARGARRTLRELFAPDEPPGGAGDCAGPKLLAEAQRQGLRPLALAELWWGAPPLAGGRRAGHYYPACRGKCGPILPFLLEGVAVDDAPLPGAAPIAADQPAAVFEDRWLVAVDKPAGLLSVPGRHARLRDSVEVRLRARYPEASGPLVAHRLDLDTSGLLLAAKDAATHAALQRQFARREIAKRYVAWLDGEVAGEHGVIELALRVDLDDRPRQLHDPVHGKPAVTAWRVLARAGGRTRVALFPATGRTHQLRLHAAHPLGLGVAIVGDPLYGQPGARLLLHAEALGFTHPHTGARVELERPAPF